MNIFRGLILDAGEFWGFPGSQFAGSREGMELDVTQIKQIPPTSFVR